MPERGFTDAGVGPTTCCRNLGITGLHQHRQPWPPLFPSHFCSNAFVSAVFRILCCPNTTVPTHTAALSSQEPSGSCWSDEHGTSPGQCSILTACAPGGSMPNTCRSIGVSCSSGTTCAFAGHTTTAISATVI